MLVCGHIIKDDEIIGIGPLMKNVPNDTLNEFYNKQNIWFELHLKGHTTRIESGWLYLGTDEKDKEATKQRKLYTEFKSGYEQVKAAVMQIIKSPV